MKKSSVIILSLSSLFLAFAGQAQVPSKRVTLHYHASLNSCEKHCSIVSIDSPKLDPKEILTETIEMKYKADSRSSVGFIIGRFNTKKTVLGDRAIDLEIFLMQNSQTGKTWVTLNAGMNEGQHSICSGMANKTTTSETADLNLDLIAACEINGKQYMLSFEIR